MRLHLVSLLLAIFSAAAGIAPYAQAADGDSQGHYRLYPTLPAPKAANSATATPSMQYYGGPVLSHVKLVSVIWGPNVNATTVKRIPGFLGAVAHSDYIGQLSEYGTHLTGVNGHAGTNQSIGTGYFAGQFRIQPANTSRSLNDAEIKQELSAQIAAGKLPKTNANTLYMIYFPASVTISSFGKSCVNFSAYHIAVSGTPGPDNIYYGVMPDCSRGFAALTIASGHEIVEAVSDAIPTPGSHPAYPQAWNTKDGYEVADLCEGTRTTLRRGSDSYTVQRVYLNSLKRCSPGPFTSP